MKTDTAGVPERNDEVLAWREHWTELRRQDRDAIPDVLGPPEAFDDVQASDAERADFNLELGPDETGPHSRTVEAVLRVCSAGRKRIPTAEDFYRAIHEPRGTDEETGLLMTWYLEAHVSDVVKGRLEGAYSWRELARALHRVGLKHGPGARRLNWFAR